MSARLRRYGLGAALAGTVALFLLALTSEAEERVPAEAKSAVGLSDVDKAESTLVTAKVQDRRGADIGAVHGITRASNGEIKTVQVALDKPQSGGAQSPSENVVALDARTMVYLREPNVILAAVTREEVQSLPRLER